MEVKRQFKKKTNKQTRNDGGGGGGGAAERKVPKHDYLTLRAPLSIS